jgi:ATP-dependent helicase/nuclease subunit A
MDSAHISTLHAFCLELVRRHFHDLSIDPDVTVLDETQTQPLIRGTLMPVQNAIARNTHPRIPR